MNRVIDHLHQNYSQKLDEAKLAKTIGISSAHMRRLVKEVTQKTITHHLIKIRMEIAGHLILNSSKNINEIANHVGYTSFTHFCNIFKKETGQTPTQYANSIGLSNKE